MILSAFVKERWNRFAAVSRKVKAFIFSVICLVLASWWLVAQADDPATTGYTTAVFGGSLAATVLAAMLLTSSKHLNLAVKDDERERLEKAAVALLFDPEGRLLFHLQDPNGTESWPNYWVPPGGLVEKPVPSAEPALNGLTLAETARRRLKLLVDGGHKWPEGILVAQTNGSKKYLQINKKETQAAVKVSAFLFHWSDSEPFVPGDQPLDRRLRLASKEYAPSNMPAYYSELLDYFDRLRAGEKCDEELECWDVLDSTAVSTHLQRGGAQDV